MHPPSRVSFSTLAFPDATLASAVSLGRRWGYAGVELRLIDGELIDPSMPAIGVETHDDFSASSVVAELLALFSVEWEKRWHPEIEAPEVALPQYRRVLAEWMEVGP